MRFLLQFSLTALLLATGCAGSERKDVVLHDEADLAGHRLTMVAGTYYDAALSARTDLQTVKYKTIADCIEALKQDMADVFVADEIFISPQTCERHGIRRAFTGKDAFPVAFAVRKGDSLAASFSAFLEDFQASGELEQRIRFWTERSEVAPEEIPVISNEGKGAPLRIGTGQDIPPLSYLAGNRWTGIEVELAERFGAFLGRPVEIRDFDFASLILGLQTKAVDMICGSIFITEERQQQVDFTAPYTVIHPAYFVLDNNAAVHRSSFRERIKDSFHQNLVVEDRWKYITSGLLVTLRISLLSILLGSLLGALICAMRLSRRKSLQRTASVYQSLMNGIPMLVLLLIMFYVVLAGSGLSAAGIAVIAFALHFAAGAASVFASGIRSVPAGQTEAGLALGFNKTRTFLEIVLPQAIRNALPRFKGNCISLLKGTSIVGYISIQDVTRAGDMIRNRTFDAFLPLAVVTLIYFVLAWAIGYLLDLAFKRSRQQP